MHFIPKTIFRPERVLRTLLLGLISSCALAAEDLLVADFEVSDFGDWKTTGEAFGNAPAKGRLPNQQEVEGFSGNGFASGFHGGDDATGTLSSPAFKIERKFLNFLIGGGGFAKETCINLKSGGKIVRTATGKNVTDGGSERLDWETWDVSDLAGKLVSIEIVDKREGTWGHLSIDHIVQSETAASLEVKREFTISQRYLVWPVTRDAAQKKRFFFTLDGETEPLAYYDICLSDQPDFWVFTDLQNFQGRKITVSGKITGSAVAAWEKVAISSTYPGEESTYKEPLRPQFHYTSRRGWLNDPNGLVWKDGEWHLFYQHNPYNHGWDNMTWGHAVSPDLFHWKELPPALFPDAEGYMYSGSGFVVPKGRAGFPVKGESSIGLAYTASGRFSFIPGREAVQGIAFSNDGGKTFTKYEGNPVVDHIRAENRDPKVFWHEPSKHWVMTLYYDGNDYGIHVSKDLVKWEMTGSYQIPGDSECPDLFELPVDGDPKNTRWVVWGANGKYMLGSFDGREFKAESGPHRHYFGSAYAGQSYSDAPNGRRVHIGWMRDTGAGLAGAPFNLQMTVPMDFTLRKVNGEIRLWSAPSEEIATLRADTKEWNNLTVAPGDADPLADFTGGHFEVEAVVDADSSASEIGFNVFGNHSATWKKADQTFTGAEGKQAPIEGKLHIRVVVDTVSMEVFVNGTYTSRYLRQTPDEKPVSIIAKEAPVRFDSLKVHSLRSAWK